MIRRRGFVLLTAFVLVAVLIVGSGYAYFYFGQGQAEATQPGVSVSIDDMQVGNVSFVGENKKYRLFLDTDGLYLIDESNPTKEAEIKLNLSDFAGNDVSLVCDLVISDPDKRGISSVNYSVTEKGEDRTEHHDVSNSILDYFEPVSINDKAFQVMEESDTEISYRCVILNILATSGDNTEVDIKVNFRYKTDNGTNMTPSSQYTTKQGFATVMRYLNEAMANGSISITFRLIATENGGTT